MNFNRLIWRKRGKNLVSIEKNDKLAIFGGNPIRKDKIYYGRQSIGEDDILSVVNVLKSDWLTQGPQIKKTQEQLCEYVGSEYAILTSSGTAALHIACLAIGIKKGDEVITSPLTFVASANCIRYCNGKVVFADVDENTYNITAESIEKKITSRTKAVIVVDYAGQPADYDEIKKVCKKYNLILIEDAAHAIGSVYKSKKVGNIADITAFSFHPVKTITGGEGGALVTNDCNLAKKIALFASHGISRNEEEFLNLCHGNWYYEQLELGYNYRITDIQAALIGSQMRKLDLFKSRRREIVNKYNKEYKKLEGLIIPYEKLCNDTCWHLYTIRIDENVLKCSRKEFFDALSAENIQPQVHYVPVYMHPYYEKLGYEQGSCPNAEKIYKGIISLPLYPAMDNKDIEDVINAVKKIHSFYKINK